MYNSKNFIAYASVISILVGVFRSLSYDADLQSSSLVKQAEDNLPSIFKESWCSHIVRNQWDRPTLLDFNEWLQMKSDTHDLMKKTNFKLKPEEQPFLSKTKTTSRIFASTSKLPTQKRKTKLQDPLRVNLAIIVSLNIICGDVQKLQARTQHKELELSLRTDSASLA